MKSVKYLEMLREKLPVKSDYAIAKALEISQGAVCHYMKGNRVMDDTTALKVAKLLEIEPMQIIAAANADREKGSNKEMWENFYKRLGGIAASIIFVVTFIMTPTPSQAAPVLKAVSQFCILC